MTLSVLDTSPTEDLLAKLSGLSEPGGNPRVKQAVQRVVSDLFQTTENFDVTPAEFWAATSYLTEAGQRNEYGLLAAGLGIENFLDLCFDAKAA